MVGNFYNLDALPYDTIKKLVGPCNSLLAPFPVTTFENDMNRKIAGPLIYYYEHYIDDLYYLASNQQNWRDYFKNYSFGIQLVMFFDFLFEETAKKLDKLQEESLKHNHLSEIKIRKGKLK
jgi:hypothetical protein